MTDEQSADHWQHLANLLGAESSSAPQAAGDKAVPAPARSHAAPAGARPEKPHPRSQPTPRTAGDQLQSWNALASELGVKVPAASLPTVAEAGPAAVRAASGATATQPQAMPPSEEAVIWPTAAETPRRLDPEGLPADVVEQESGFIEEVVDFRAEPSAHHAAARAPNAEAEEDVAEEGPRGTRRRGRRRRRGRSRDRESQAARRAPDAVESDTQDDPEVVKSASAPDRAHVPSPPRQRDRLREPGWRADEVAAAEFGEDESDVWHDPSQLEDVAPRSSADSGPSEEDEHDAACDKPSHRQITSWEEAIGSIVDHNLRSRTRSPGSGRSGGGRPPRRRPSRPED